MIGMTAPARILLAGGLAAAALGFSPDLAHAAYSARVETGTLTLKGNAASDKLVLRLAPGAPGTLQADVGADGTADFSFDRSTFTADRRRGRRRRRRRPHRPERRDVHRRARDHERRLR